MTPYELWERGVALWEALMRGPGGGPWRLEQERIIRGFEALRTDPGSPLIDRLWAIDRLQAMGESWDRHQRRLGELQAALLDRLRAGRAVACGFLGDAEACQRLVGISREAWARAKVDWLRSAVVSGEATFKDVRVLVLDAEPVVAGDGRRPDDDRGGDAPA